MKLTLEKSAEKYFKNNRDALKDYVGFSKDGAAFTVNFLPDGSKSRISVSKDENGINISCPEKYFMRALGIAVKNRNKKSYSVTERPRFEDLTFLIDCSRNGVINFATFKNLVVKLALIGYNAVQIYTEDTLELEGEPYFGHLRGRFSPAEMKAMDEFAASVGVEVVPFIQTLAHLDNIFLWPEYSMKIWDIYNVVLIGEEATYALIEKIFKTLRGCLKTDKVNIGFDEANCLCMGKYAEKNGFPVDKPKILTDHLKKVLSIAEKYGFHAQMWSDMFFRLAYDGLYHVEPDADDEPLKKIKKLIPENVDLIYWDYYHEDKALYDGMFRKHKLLTKKVRFACGVWKWLGYAPFNEYGVNRIIPGIASAADNKISDIIVTSWGDNGNETPLMSTIPQIVAAAETAYLGKFDLNKVKKCCKEIFSASYDDFLLLDLPNRVDREFSAKNPCNPSKYLLYNDPVYGLFDYHTSEEHRKHFADCVKPLKAAAKRNPSYRYVFDLEAALCEYLGVKANFGNTLKALYKSGDKDGLKNFAEKTVPLAVKKLDAFILAVRNSWLGENKIFGLDLLEIRLGGQKQRLNEIVLRINDYLCGRTETLPELEQENLFFGYPGEGKELTKGLYAYMATPDFALERY
ncbi:MAG: hypothetical protein IK147_04610 [Clostridia bacterium]|nr:hypothetical protein [Clostridia bacterium]